MAPVRNSRETIAAALSSSSPVAPKPAKKTLTQSTLSFAPASAASSSSSSKVAPKAVVLKKPTTASAVPPESIPPASPETLKRFKALYPGQDASIAGLLDLELRTMGEDWLAALKDELVKPGFLQLKSFLVKDAKSNKIFPPEDDIYSFTRLSKLEDVRLIIIGQDPYHQPGQAHGLSFSVRKGVQVPPSLRNIYKEISNEYPGFKVPKHGDLTSLAKQGVLLLNTSLTVRANAAASHSKAGWEPFTKAILRLLAATSAAPEEGKVFMCWGKHAENAIKGLVDEKKHLVLRSVHPSPLSAARGFFDTGHFKQADEWLKERRGESGGVDWTKIGSD